MKTMEKHLLLREKGSTGLVGPRSRQYDLSHLLRTLHHLQLQLDFPEILLFSY